MIIVVTYVLFTFIFLILQNIDLGSEGKKEIIKIISFLRKYSSAAVLTLLLSIIGANYFFDTDIMYLFLIFANMALAYSVTWFSIETSNWVYAKWKKSLR